MSHLSNAHVSPVSRPVPSSAAPTSPGLAIARGGAAKGAAGAGANGSSPKEVLSNARTEVRGPEAMAQTLYTQLREAGYSEQQVIALAGELLSLVTADVRSQSQG